MPKLTKKYAQTAKAAAADWGDGFEPLKPGRYLAKLVSVEVKQGQAADYWEWKFEELSSHNHLWENTSLSEKAIGRLGKMFEAFGVPADTDTDELIQKVVCLVVGTRTIPQGERAGQLQNTIQAALPPGEHPDYDPDEHGGSASASDYGADDESGSDPDADEAASTDVLAAMGAAAEAAEGEGDEAECLLKLGEALGIDDSQYEWVPFAAAIGEALADADLDPTVREACDEIAAEYLPEAPVEDEEPF